MALCAAVYRGLTITITLATRGRRGVGPSRGDESAGGSQALAQQAQKQTGVPLPPPPPPVDYGALMQGLAPAHEAVFGGVPMMERFRRMTPPFFKGESDPILAKSWLRETRKIFRAIRCVEEERVTLATYMLQERTDVCLSSILHTQFGDGAMEVAWVEFVHLFKVNYIPEHMQDHMEHEFLTLTQGSLSVLEYEARFTKLSKDAPHIVADEWRKVKKLIMGLKPSLRMTLVALGHRSMEEALSVACLQEAEMEVYKEEKRASLKRPTSAFQMQDRKKKAPAF
ncbi:hypothetical protein Taro_047962 [Colocasia esculenta]|uniref:Retrotransposon gag domain-containing protein n=1 Tax=Colocasia esculenta TaxID=4460 RepID=A0A843X1Z6_COLES|nr:hypothetical protein [Colocasia esculenta]